MCKDPGGEEEMVFCDHCDRGYHTFCLSMQGIPEGMYMCIHCLLSRNINADYYLEKYSHTVYM